MFESFLAVPLHFAIEFVGFLLTAGGAFVVIFRHGLVPGPSANRVTVGLGLASLAIAQVIHGGSFVESDAGEALIAVQALGYALILVGISGGIRPAAAAFLGADRPVLLAPAGAAALLAVVSFAGSLRAETRDLRRLAAAAACFSVASAFAAANPNSLAGTASADGLLAAAHAVRLLGFIALASWLWTGVRTSISTRFVASFVTLLVVVVLALSASLTAVITNNIEQEELRRVAGQAVAAVETIEGSQTRQMADKVAQIAGLPNIQQAVAQGDSVEAGNLARDALAAPIFEDLDFLAFTTPSRKLLGFNSTGPAVRRRGGRVARVKLRRIDVLTIIGSPVVKDVASGRVEQAAGPDRIDALERGSAAILVAVEVRNVNRLVGLAVGGRFLDALTAETITSNVSPARASLLVGRRLIASDLAGDFAVPELLPAELRTDLASGKPVSAQITVDGREFFTAYRPISNARGLPVATLAISAPARVVQSAREGITRSLFLVALGVAAAALVLAWFSGRRITRPIKVLTHSAGAVREGNLDVETKVTGEDEVGQLGETFNDMTAALRRMTGDLRQAAREERQLRGRIETIIQSMADGLVAVDPDGKILAFNREAEKLTGYEAGRVIGEPVRRVLNLTDAEDQPIAAPIFDLTEGFVGGAFLRPRVGERIPVALTCAVLRGDGGEVTGAVAVLRNMTREREIERMKSQFLSNISHELRTPLTPIKGYAEILGREGVAPEKTQQFAKGILESTARLERIVELLVDFSAMEAGRLAPRTRPIDLAKILRSLGDHWSVRSPSHRFVIEVPEGLPQALGDERLLRRSLEEVVDNAVKFSPTGGEVRLEARGTQVGNGEGRRRAVEVSVVDEGIGIPPEDLPRIFSDFQQLDGSETRTYGGLGLGLAFVSRIIEALNGDVRVESEPNEGTTLTITLPAADGEPARESAASD